MEKTEKQEWTTHVKEKQDLAGLLHETLGQLRFRLVFGGRC